MNAKCFVGFSTAVLCVSGSLHAALLVTNGNFESAPASDNQTDVTGWYDYGTDQPFYLQTWLEGVDNHPSDNGYSLALAGGFDSWAFQPIGTRGSTTTATVKFKYGSFTDSNGPRNLSVTWSAYFVGGAYTPADNVDIASGTGVTLLDSKTVATANAQITDQINDSITLNLSGASAGDQIYLRVSNLTANGTSEYGWVDNVSIGVIPEPCSLALFVVGTGGLLVGRRRR